MSKIKYFILFVLFLSLPFSLHAQSKALKGTAIIGTGKVIKNSKTFQNTKDVVKAGFGTNSVNNNISEQYNDNLKYNNQDNIQSENREDTDIFTSTLLDLKNDFIKSNKQNINKIEKSVEGFKEIGDGIGSLFGGITKGQSQSSKDNIYYADDDPKDLRKMSKDELDDYFGDNNWHQKKEKKKLVDEYKDDLKGSTNADLYVSKKTGRIYLKGNKEPHAIVEVK